ncbi:MAG: B12-binding domain-containing radical SAM protein [Desulfomonile sp.]|nr:B12-binding domain-containing radical SAM protein [Desulfomonile sp.]
MQALLVNAKADFSFWSLPESCSLKGTKTLAPPLGLITVGALLPPEWKLRLVDLNTREIFPDDWDWADVVLISGMIGQRTSLLRTVREAKRRGKLVVAGGPYPTAVVPEVVEAGANFVVRGEGENTVPMLLEALKGGKNHGVIQNEAKPDLSASPIPRFDLLSLSDYQILMVQSSRGCPFDCEFCDIVNLYGRKPRFKTPDQMIDELQVLYGLGWRGEVFIGDDNFIGSRSHARALLNKLIEWQTIHGEPFSFMTQASVNLGKDLETIDLMTAANFGKIFIGLESVDEDALEIAHKYHNLRNSMMECVKTLNKNGLSVMGSFVIGFDGERKGTDERINAFVEETGIPIVMVNVLNALPDTALWKRLEKEGRLLETMHLGDDMIGDQVNFVPTRPKSEILKEVAGVWDYLYEPERFLRRAGRYYVNMRPTRAALGVDEPASGPSVRGAKVPIRETLRTVRAFFRLIWRMGVRPPYRLHFWRQLLEVYRKNPSRWVLFITCCALGLNMFSIREMVLKARAQSRDTPHEEARWISRVAGPTARA